MIGVLVPPEKEVVVREFFELFKTPWELARPGMNYDVLLVTDRNAASPPARLVIEFTTTKLVAPTAGVSLDSPVGRLPVYRGVSLPDGTALPGHSLADESRAWVSELAMANVRHLCVGYDLFAEIAHLLTAGQPVHHAASPTLELHVALLRSWITGSGIPLVEIPPMPVGHPFIVCLTHDVDHPVMRRHTMDATMLGFLHRAVFGSLKDALGGRIPWRRAGRNWLAVLRLPLMLVGLVPDLWRQSLLAYARLEQGLASTFFVIPFRGRPGRRADGGVSARRAAGYGVEDIRSELKTLQTAGCEVGLHGIDAWRDPASGTEEAAAIARCTGVAEQGIRMHWLYFDGAAHHRLEAAGFCYDSTVGYNETVGYRAGTCQVFRPLGVQRLLELPLHIMDTALFYPGYLHLNETEARLRVQTIMAIHLGHGGVLTVNWHDRSIAPERLWDGFYLRMIDDLRRLGVWFATGRQAVEWFRFRRETTFEVVEQTPGALRVRIKPAAGDCSTDLPGLRLRFHRPLPAGGVVIEEIAAIGEEFAFAT